MLQGFLLSLHIFINMKKETLKVKANTRFLFATTGRIYDPGDVFECSQADADYLTEHKLCDLADKDAEIAETEQDKAERIASGNSTEEEKMAALAVINQMDETIASDEDLTGNEDEISKGASENIKSSFIGAEDKEILSGVNKPKKGKK